MIQSLSILISERVQNRFSKIFSLQAFKCWHHDYHHKVVLHNICSKLFPLAAVSLCLTICWPAGRFMQNLKDLLYIHENIKPVTLLLSYAYLLILLRVHMRCRICARRDMLCFSRVCIFLHDMLVPEVV